MWTLIKKLKSALATWVGNVQWKQSRELSGAELDEILERLTPHYYIILTRRSNHLSTYVICLANLILTGKWGHYSHVLMNLEDEVTEEKDFRLIEATGKGIHYSLFQEVFGGIDSVALLKPKNMSLDAWTAVMDKAKTQLGKPYDTLFDLKNDLALSCVELVRVALQAESNYTTNFSNFEKMISECKNLTPNMFLQCSDFEVVYEVRR